MTRATITPVSSTSNITAMWLPRGAAATRRTAASGREAPIVRTFPTPEGDIGEVVAVFADSPQDLPRLAQQIGNRGECSDTVGVRRR